MYKNCIRVTIKYKLHQLYIKQIIINVHKIINKKIILKIYIFLISLKLKLKWKIVFKTKNEEK